MMAWGQEEVYHLIAKSLSQVFSPFVWKGNFAKRSLLVTSLARDSAFHIQIWVVSLRCFAANMTWEQIKLYLSDQHEKVSMRPVAFFVCPDSWNVILSPDSPWSLDSWWLLSGRWECITSVINQTLPYPDCLTQNTRPKTKEQSEGRTRKRLKVTWKPSRVTL